MSTSSWPEVDRILRRALELQGTDRQQYLDSTCGSNTELQSEVQSILQMDTASGSSNSGWGMQAVTQPVAPAALVGRQLGAYRLVDQLGSGGMGLVYRARRHDGQFDKDVAIKILFWGLHDDILSERFGQERRFLAKLDHPGITRLLDSGISDDGLPYLVMELVEGVPITAYGRSAGLSKRQSVELIAKVCDAVHYAHQNLVVHRDLKPGNILVRADGEPKLLDFGVAKWLADATVTLNAGSGWAPFTPKYASPEQLRGGAITTASDIYSLGLILLELIDGHLSLESVRAKDADLAAIVRKSTAHEPRERYSSAAEFASDLNAYAAGRPVKARRWSVPLAVSKWIKRHKRVTVLLAANAALLVTLAVRYEVESARAIQHAKDLRELSGSVSNEVIRLIGDLPKATLARQKLATQSLKYLERLHNQTSDPVLLSEVAEGYGRLADITGNRAIGSAGDWPAALELHKRAVELIEKSRQADPRNLAIQQRQARILTGQSNIQPAAEAKATILLAERIFEGLRGKVPETEDFLYLEGKLNYQRAVGVNGWGSALNQPYLERALAAYRKLAARYPDNLNYKMQVADMLGFLSEIKPTLEERVAGAMEGAALRHEIAGREPQNPYFQMSIWGGENSIGSMYRVAGLPKPALPYVRKGVPNLRRAAELDPGDAGIRAMLAFAIGDLAALEAQCGNRKEAEMAATEAIPMATRLLAKDPALFRPNWALGHAYRALGDVLPGDRCANYAKALMHAQKANASIGGRNPSVLTLIQDIQRARARCSVR